MLSERIDEKELAKFLYVVFDNDDGVPDKVHDAAWELIRKMFPNAPMKDHIDAVMCNLEGANNKCYITDPKTGEDTPKDFETFYQHCLEEIG